jgi:PAS domain S-box-containing protein
MPFISSSLSWIQKKFPSGLYRAIVITAVVFIFLFAAIMRHSAGAGTSIIFLSWFIPVIGLFNALSLFAVAFLAAGRFNVLDDPSSFWISMGSIGFGVAFIFHILTWPGFLPTGIALIIPFPGTSVWLLQFGRTIFSIFLLAAALVNWPTNRELAGNRLIVATAVWTGALTITFSLFIFAQPYVPELLEEAATFSLSLRAWNAVLAFLFASGAILSTRLYLKTGNSLPGYIAFAQMGFAFALLITLSGMRHYDLWWYLTRIVSTASILVTLFGILSEYVQLFRREKQSRDFMGFALESSHTGAWQFDLKDQTANQTMEHSRIFGYDHLLPEWSYERFLDHILPEDHDAVHTKIQKAIAKNSDWHFECRIRRFDNEVRWIFVAGSPKKDAMGNNRWAMGIVQDITERKRVEEALRESEERFRGLITSSSEVLYRMSPDWSEMRQLHSRGFPAETIKPNPHWFNEYIPPGDQAAVKAAIDEAIRTRRVFEMEHRIQQADGSMGWTFSRAVPIFDEHGNIVEWFGAASDITGRKKAENALRESEERLRMTLLSAADEIWIVDAQQRIVSISDSVMENLGVNSDKWADIEAALNQLEVLHPNGSPRSREDNILPRALRGEVIKNQQEIIRNLATGQLHWREVSGVPVRDSEGTIIGAVAVARDITDRKQVEKELRRLNESLEEKVAERTRLAESRSKQLQRLSVELIEAEEKERKRIAEFLHEDLQQIIVSVRMQLHTLLPKTDSDPILENVDRLLIESIEKSRRLAHELSPPVLYQFGLPVSLKWLVRHMDEHFGMKVQIKEEMTHEISDKSLQVFLFRAAQELLFNSVKHSGKKNASVSLFEDENTLTLCVCDEGTGYNPELLDPDKRFGLGLISLQERTRALGGEMKIESAPGEGSKISLSIPLNLSESQDSAIFISETEPGPAIFNDKTTVSPPGTIRVLFADDHKVMRQGLISMIADKPGIVVAGEAESGEEALELARQLSPDVIIMDISMPGIGGVEATRLIKAENPEIRVIGLSMFAGEDISQKMLEAGADGFVSKNKSSSELLKAIYDVAG